MDLDRNCLKADCHAPFPWFQVSCNSGSGGSQRRTQAGHCALCYAVTERPSLAVIGKEAVSLYPVLRSLRDPLPLTRLSTISKSMAKGRGSLHFQTSYPRERFEEKNYRQIPQGMLRYAAPPSCGSKHRAAPAAGALNDKTFAVSMHSAWSQLSRKKLKSKKSPTYCKKLTKSLTTAI